MSDFPTNQDLALLPRPVPDTPGNSYALAVKVVRMVLVIRRFLAVLAGYGLATSIAVYLESFSGTTFDSLKLLPFVLHLGGFALVVPMVVIEYSSFEFETPPWIWFSGGRPIKRGSFSWKG